MFVAFIETELDVRSNAHDNGAKRCAIRRKTGFIGRCAEDVTLIIQLHRRDDHFRLSLVDASIPLRDERFRAANLFD